jgi:hypothetical protein
MGKEIVHREGAEKNLKHGGKEEAEEREKELDSVFG